MKHKLLHTSFFALLATFSIATSAPAMIDDEQAGRPNRAITYIHVLPFDEEVFNALTDVATRETVPDRDGKFVSLHPAQSLLRISLPEGDVIETDRTGGNFLLTHPINLDAKQALYRSGFPIPNTPLSEHFNTRRNGSIQATLTYSYATEAKEKNNYAYIEGDLFNPDVRSGLWGVAPSSTSLQGPTLTIKLGYFPNVRGLLLIHGINSTAASMTTDSAAQNASSSASAAPSSTGQ